jgi:hypothetical protein
MLLRLLGRENVPSRAMKKTEVLDTTTIQTIDVLKAIGLTRGGVKLHSERACMVEIIDLSQSVAL